MPSNVESTLTHLMATVDDLAQPNDAAALLRELKDRLEFLVARHESETHHG